MTDNSNNWVKSGNSYFVRSNAMNVDLLPNGVYTISVDPMTKQANLEYIKERFEFPYKVYGIESSFVARVKKTWENTKSNLGILMNGIKGTGKSVTCEQICNHMDMPVILVTSDFPGLVEFMTQFNQDAVFFFDEYEKVFGSENRSERSYKLLSVMDGCLNTKYRKMFLFTTNNLHVDDNLLQRPGRIRYLKKFGNLSIDAVIEIVDDKLENKELRNEVIKAISQLDLITVDIAVSLISEVNIHNEPPEAFLPFFNVEKLQCKMDVFVQNVTSDWKSIAGEAEKQFGASMTVNITGPYDDSCLGDSLTFNGSYRGDICDYNEDGRLMVRKSSRKGDLDEYQAYRMVPIQTYKQGFLSYIC